MAWEESDQYEKKVAIAWWVDTYTARFDQALTTAWPDLADRLRAAVATLSWSELAFGPGKEFKKKQIEPAIRDWTQLHVQPIIEAAQEEFRRLVQTDETRMKAEAEFGAVDGGALEFADLLKALGVPGGLLLGGGAIAALITEGTVWLVFTTIVVNWPVLICGLLVGGVLALFGAGSIGHMLGQLQDRFTKRILPTLERAIIGEGTEHDGKHIPSLKDALKQMVHDAADAVRQALEKTE